MREPIHPGETLREDLDALGMSASELARQTEVPMNRSSTSCGLRNRNTGDDHLAADAHWSMILSDARHGTKQMTKTIGQELEHSQQYDSIRFSGDTSLGKR